MKVLLTATLQSHICQFHRPLVEMLHENGCDVHVAAKDNLAEKNGLKLDFVDKIYDIPFNRSPKSPANVIAYERLKAIIDGGEYDIIHCNTPVGGVITRFAARGAREHGTKVYYTAHGFHFYKGAPRKNWYIYYPIERVFANRYTDKLITINEEDYDIAKANFNCPVARIHGVGVDSSRYTRVDNVEKNRLRSIMGYDEDQPIILCVGELLPNKNQKLAILMMKHLVADNPKAMLLIAGNGQERDRLEALVAELGLESNVEFLGYVTNLQDYQNIADVLVSCSKREGMPLNIVEALLSGTPVVASSNRGHRELIEDEVNGYIVDSDNPQAYAERVAAIIDNKNLANSFAEQGLVKSGYYCSMLTKQELKSIYEFE